MNGPDIRQSIADSLGLLRAHRAGDLSGVAEVICAMSGDEVHRSYLALLLIANRLASEVDRVRESVGLDGGHADALLAHLAEHA
ncbi:MAG: hypothetical protein ACR2FU_11295 [Streptosporangiaceae bacterium]